ncbi:uncharacterized protein LOC144717789 isoform X3 [Lampetra planeri]
MRPCIKCVTTCLLVPEWGESVVVVSCRPWEDASPSPAVPCEVSSTPAHSTSAGRHPHTSRGGEAGSRAAVRPLLPATPAPPTLTGPRPCRRTPPEAVPSPPLIRREDPGWSGCSWRSAKTTRRRRCCWEAKGRPVAPSPSATASPAPRSQGQHGPSPGAPPSRSSGGATASSPDGGTTSASLLSADEPAARTAGLCCHCPAVQHRWSQVSDVQAPQKEEPPGPSIGGSCGDGRRRSSGSYSSSTSGGRSPRRRSSPKGRRSDHLTGGRRMAADGGADRVAPRDSAQSGDGGRVFCGLGRPPAAQLDAEDQDFRRETTSAIAPATRVEASILGGAAATEPSNAILREAATTRPPDATEHLGPKALSHIDLHKFPVNCQPQIFKLSQDINKLDPKGKWKVVAELTKRFQVSPTDMWQTGKEKMTRLVKTEPPTPPPPDYKQDLPYKVPYKSEACIYDDCITQAGQHQASNKESSTQDSSSDSDMDYIIPNGASANLGNLSPAKGSQKPRRPKPVEHMNAFDYENEEDISPQNTVAATRGVLKSVRATLIPRGNSTSRAGTPPSPVPRPSHLQSSLSISSCGPGRMKNSVQGEKDLPKETSGKELHSRRCFYGAIHKGNSESQSGHGRGQLPQLPVASSSWPLPDARGMPRAFIPLPQPPLSNFSAGLRPALDSVGGSDVAKGAPRNFTAPRLITAAGAPTPSSSCPHSNAGMGGCRVSATLPWPTTADSASSSFNDLQTKKWYAGKCDSRLAKKVVQSYNKDGAFLVRQSSGDTVTQPYTLVVHYGGSIYNLRLYWDPISTKFYLNKELHDGGGSG